MVRAQYNFVATTCLKQLRAVAASYPGDEEFPYGGFFLMEGRRWRARSECEVGHIMDQLVTQLTVRAD